MSGILAIRMNTRMLACCVSLQKRLLAQTVAKSTTASVLTERRFSVERGQPPTSNSPTVIQLVRCYSTHDYEMTYEELKALLNTGGVQLFDVREPSEIERDGEVLQNAANLPLGQVKEALVMTEEAFAEKYKCARPQKWDANVIFYGLGPIKSTAAVELAHKAGYTKARHYPGGIAEWKSKH
ncbi:PREDICTED: uncharacterized protein LOC106818131 [Priapulus caudatus]|uniref:Uncharacterized protein LOC106818131 n=1 Tax=Priapulus caudatus TaxID=37621 RepID=A0ABM1F1L5_PRICU|nr:PREDICTED: uncharacterized protein LOC106818131 [Priapulus caudatus]